MATTPTPTKPVTGSPIKGGAAGNNITRTPGSPGAQSGTPPTPGAGLVVKSAVQGAKVAQPVIAAAAPKPPPFQISSVHEAQRWLKLFVYANYGIGKTALVGSAALVPQMQDVLMIDSEAGDLTISSNAEISQEEYESRIDRVSCPDFKTFSRLQEFLKLHCKYRDENDTAKLKELEKRLRSDYDPDAPPRKYKTVIIDSLSELEAFSMYGLLGITERTSLDEEVAGAEFKEYKQNNQQILRAIRAYRDLPLNVLITCASLYIQNDAKRMIYQPALTGKLSKQVQGFMDVVGFMAVVNGGEGVGEVRRMFIQPGPNYDAKCRFANYKEKYFDNPTIGSVLKAVGLLEAPVKK